jgi:hypothetical protein
MKSKRTLKKPGKKTKGRSVEDAMALLLSLDDKTRRVLLNELQKVTIKEFV